LTKILSNCLAFIRTGISIIAGRVYSKMGRSIPKDSHGELKTNKITINTIIVHSTSRSKNQE
jgi:vacuolar-type H+-ATPase subunit B/Vma2